MDYANAQLTQAVAGQRYPDSPATPHFDGLPQVAERAEMVCDRLQRFLDRFHGADVKMQGAGQLAPVPAGHVGQFERIGRAIGQLEALASQIDAIG